MKAGVWLSVHFQMRRVPEDSLWEKSETLQGGREGQGGGQGVKDGFMAGAQPKLRKDPEAEEVAITSTHLSVFSN